MAIDREILLHMMTTCVFIVYTDVGRDLEIEALLQGSLACFFFVLGNIMRQMAYRYGPGGPIEALTSTRCIF